MIRLLLISLGIAISPILSAQICSTPQEPLLERVEVNKKNMIPLQRGATKYIPITFHLVAASNGTGRVTEEGILAQLAYINEAYADQDIKFYIDRFNYFDNDAVYNTPASTPAKTQMKLRRDNNAINVFITNTADSGNGGPGVTLAYYDPQEDWIVSRKSQINGGSNSVSHELGHFFSLAHPFVGWDCNPYSFQGYGNPVNVEFTIPCEGGGGSVLIELHDRSNCNTAGDRICDTPEDYNLGLLFQPNDCNENTVVKDMNNEVIKPMTNNFMSYYNNCTDYEFTPTQKNLINTDYMTPQRMYIRTGFVPNITPVEEDVQYISPINGMESNGTTDILLDWEDTPGANKYLVIYDRFASFTNSPVRAIVTSSEYVITAQLIEGITYHWKVWPYNESMTGAGFSPTQNFKASEGVAVNEIHDITGYSISPNPASDEVTSFLTLSSATAFTGQLELMDASGHLYINEKIEIPAGFSQHPIPHHDLPAGIYFVVLQSEKGRLVERLMIME